MLSSRSCFAVIVALCSVSSVEGRAGTPAEPELLAQQVLRPAFYTRLEETVTLLPGLKLRQGDALRTGSGGHLQVVGLGLHVLLGERSHARLESLAEGAPELRLVEGVMDVAGAAGLRLQLGRVLLRLQAGSVWVDAAPLRETACLRSGAAQASVLGSTLTLSAALPCVRDTGQGLVRFTPTDQEWQAMVARSAFPATASPGLPSSGWTLVVASIADLPSAEAEAEGLRGEGLVVQVLPVTQNGQRSYRVAVGGFATREQAEAYRQRLRERHAILEAWPAPY